MRLIWQPPAAPNGIILGKSAPSPVPFLGRKEEAARQIKKAEMGQEQEVSSASEKRDLTSELWCPPQCLRGGGERIEFKAML